MAILSKMQSNTRLIILILWQNVYVNIITILRRLIKISDFCISKYLYGFSDGFHGRRIRNFSVIGNPSTILHSLY